MKKMSLKSVRKMVKVLKVFTLSMTCALSAFAIVGLTMTCKGDLTQKDILYKYDYDSFNSNYKLEKVEHFLDNNQDDLAYDEFMLEAKNLEDYDQNKFISEFASEEDINAYENAEVVEDLGRKILLGGAVSSGLATIGGVLGLAAASKKEDDLSLMEVTRI